MGTRLLSITVNMGNSNENASIHLSYKRALTRLLKAKLTAKVSHLMMRGRNGLYGQITYI